MNIIQVGPVGGVDKTPVVSKVNVSLVSELKGRVLERLMELVGQDNEIKLEERHKIENRVVNVLQDASVVEVTGGDAEARAPVVTFQKAFEEVILELLKEREIDHATGVVHTGTPTTALCTPEAEVDMNAIGDGMQSDAARVKTVRDRTITIRRLIEYGREQAVLYVAYPKGGLEKRSGVQQGVYKTECAQGKNVGLIDSVLDCGECPADVSGASYLLRVGDERFFFSLNGVQAKDSESGFKTWTVWFGDIKDTACNERWSQVAGYLKAGGLELEV